MIFNFKLFKCVLVHYISHPSIFWIQKFIQIFARYFCTNIWALIYQRHQFRYFSNHRRSSRSIIFLLKKRLSTNFKIKMIIWKKIKSLGRISSFFRIRIICIKIWKKNIFRLVLNWIVLVIRLLRLFKTRRSNIGLSLGWFILAKWIYVWKCFSFRI